MGHSATIDSNPSNPNDQYSMMKEILPFEARYPSDVIGNWGPIQRRIFIFLTLIYLCGPLNNASIVFYQPQYDFFCNFLNHTTGSYDKLKNTCVYPDVTGVEQPCSNFTYDDRVFKRTIVSEFDLICSRSYYGSVSQSFHQIGYLVSGVSLGYLSDVRGRKTAAVIAILIEILAGFGQVLSPSIYFFWFSRFLLGFSAYGRFMASYVLLSEWIGPEARAQAIAMFEYGWMTGQLILPMVFYAIPDYKMFQTVVSSYEILMFIPFLLFVWESPKWLLTHGRFDQVEKTLTIAAVKQEKFSNSEIHRRIQSIKSYAEKNVIADHAGKQSVIDALKVPVIRKISLILYFVWFSIAFVFYAFSLNMQNLGGDLFTNFFLFALVDMIVHTILYFFINRFARKTLLDVSLGIQVVALSCLLVTSFNDNLLIYRITACCFLKIGLSVSTIINYLYTAETFPTSMRQSSIGTCSIFARFGSITAPFVKELTNATHLFVPTVIFMLFTVMNLVLIQFIPETGKIQMPDTIGQKKHHLDQSRG